MNSRLSTGLALGIGLLVGLALGRFSQAAKPDDSPTEDLNSAKLSPGPCISVPVSSAVKTLQESRFSLSGFDNMNPKLPDAMAFLGIAKEDQQAVITLFRDIEKRILSEEKQRLKVSKVTDTEIVIDHSAMLEPVKQFAGEAREGIRANLPPNYADVLVQAIDWDRFYMHEEGEPVSTFQIVRSSSRLMAKRIYPQGSTTKALNRNQYQDDGTAIPAREAFRDARWASFLGDHKLLPVDDTEQSPSHLRAPTQKFDTE